MCVSAELTAVALTLDPSLLSKHPSLLLLPIAFVSLLLLCWSVAVCSTEGCSKLGAELDFLKLAPEAKVVLKLIP